MPDLETATLGGGCFWCLEPVFASLAGVESVEPGYAGGHDPSPNYRKVCGGGTGHAEVVQVRFDPQVVGFRDLLAVFFAIHDPTTPERQGADRGPQYRSIILHHTPEQGAIAHTVIDELDGSDRWDAPVATEVVPLETFHPAEPEHRGYYRRNPDVPYCRIVIDPKLERLRRDFRHRLRDAPDRAPEPGQTQRARSDR